MLRRDFPVGTGIGPGDVRPVALRAASLTLGSEYWPTPRVKSSISSRARFSFGLPFRFDGESSQASRAGSRSISRSNLLNGPRPWRRIVSFCRSWLHVLYLELACREVVVPHSVRRRSGDLA